MANRSGKLTCAEIREAISGGDALARNRVRVAFLKLPFEEQAGLIGQHARDQYQTIDNFIGPFWQGGGVAPKAREVWSFIQQRGLIPTPDAVATYFPKLQSRTSSVQRRDRPDPTPAEMLSVFLTGFFAFWVENFYLYDRTGNFNWRSLDASPARSFTKEQERAIDARADGLTGLGRSLRGYADFLAAHADEVIVRDATAIDSR